MRHLKSLLSLSGLALLTASACNGVTELEPSPPGASDEGTGGVGNAANGGDTGGSIEPSPIPTDSTTGGAGGAPVMLPPFDCTDPTFFPLRLDENGNPIEPEQSDGSDVVPAGGAGGSSGSEVGSGDLTVLLVFDKSGSMDSHWGAKSRWQAGSDAVLLGLDGILDVVTMGALFFPFDTAEDTQGCGVPPIEIDPQIDFTSGLGFKEQWVAGACGAQPLGATPLERALQVADAAIESAEQRSLIKARMRVILVTDGEPTCEDDLENIVALPTKWSEQGIETHVIGLPGSDSAATLLDSIAQAGGTEEHFAPLVIGELEDEVYDLLR